MICLNNSLSDKVSQTDVVDNLTSTDTNLPLSANQGRELKAQLDRGGLVNQAAGEVFDIDGKYIPFVGDGSTIMGFIPLPFYARNTNYTAQMVSLNIDSIGDVISKGLTISYIKYHSGVGICFPYSTSGRVAYASMVCTLRITCA